VGDEHGGQLECVDEVVFGQMRMAIQECHVKLDTVSDYGLLTDEAG
jgi:hypothetical protein